MTTTDEILQAIGNDSTPIEMMTTPARLFILLGQLQLALRHPRNIGSGRQVAEQIFNNMARTLYDFHPEAQELIEQGWDTTLDVSREQYDLIQEQPEMLDPIRVMNASNLLLSYAEAAGKPIILAANAELTHADGLQDGNPEAADLELLKGLVFAMPCNPLEAQILINGINTLLAGMPYMTGEIDHDDT